ncbi:MAG: M3 family metallopeptidase [Candidatus Tumulicola sp.]
MFAPRHMLVGAVAAFALVLTSAGGARAAQLQAAHPTVFDWDLSPAQIAANCKRQIAATDAVVQRVIALSGERTFDNTVLPVENAEADLNDRLVPEGFLFNVSTSKPVRDASEQCGADQNAYFAKIGASPQLYQALAAVNRGSVHGPYQAKDLELFLTGLKRSGASLPAEQRKEVVRLENELTELGNHFQENLSNDASTITISQNEAQSLSADFVAGLVKNADGTYVVPVNESTVVPFLNNERQADARKRYYFAYNNRSAKDNLPILQKALATRDQLAHVFGYPTWAAYVLADRMAGTPQRVMTFLNNLDEKLLPKANDDIAALTQLKVQETGDPNARLEAWDVTYYNNALFKTKYAVDGEVIRRYFPVQHTIDGVLNLYHKLLGITFVKIAHPKAWYPDVIGYDVFDTASGRFIGSTFFDLYPRPGKFEHFANWPLAPVRLLPSGFRPPVAAILGNWPKPAPGHPALLSHDDVVTFFHEFGHDLAALLGTAPYETLSAGFRADFVEAPSQMLENFMWQPSILKEISSNVDTGAPLPDDLIQKMVAARYVNNAYFTTRQIMLATVDMDYHTMTPPVDTTAVWARVAKDETPMPIPDGIHPQASFGHLFGYDAGYYGYLWSLVYAQDMFTAFQKGGLENPQVGMRYRKDILEPARTYEPDREVETFLGRPMDPSAFYAQFGISNP